MYSIPPWIGYTYFEFDTDVGVYHLIPFNRIIRALKDLLYWIRWGKAKEELFAKKMDINKRSYDKGFRDGEKIGYDKGLLIYGDLMNKATGYETKTP